jgi:hypothetical protein
VGSTNEGIKTKLLNGRPIQFLSTGNFDLWLSDLGHSELMHKSGLSWKDIESEGYLIIDGGEPKSYLYGNSGSNTEKAIEDKISSFLK